MNAALEIPVAAQDGDGDQIVVLDGRANRFRQRAAVANTSGANRSRPSENSISRDMCQSCSEQVIGHHFRTGRRLVLTHGFTCKPRSTAFFASSPAPSMSEGRSVGAAGDCRNDHCAARKVKRITIVSNRDMLRRCSSTTFVKEKLRLAKRDAILRTLGAGNSRLNGS